MSARNTLGLVWAVAAYGQSISIINPKAGSTVSGEVELRRRLEHSQHRFGRISPKRLSQTRHIFRPPTAPPAPEGGDR